MNAVSRRTAISCVSPALPGNPARDDFSLDEYLFFLFAQIDHAYAREMEIALKAAGTDRPGWRVLMTLAQKNPCSVSEIAAYATMKRPTISRVVERMRAAGLVRTGRGAADSRVTEVHLLPAGRRTLNKLRKVAGREYQRALAGIDEAELAALIDTLNRIRANLGVPADEAERLRAAQRAADR